MRSGVIALSTACALLMACQDDVRIAHAPTAFAGFDRLHTVGDEVVLDASQSTDPDGDVLTFAWRLVSTPADATSTLDTSFGPVVRFVPDQEGVYVASLSATDGDGVAHDLVAVTVLPARTSTTALDLVVEPRVCQAQLGSFDDAPCGSSADRVSFRAIADGADRIEWRLARLPTGVNESDLSIEQTALGPFVFEPTRPGNYWLAANARNQESTSPTVIVALGVFDDDVTQRPLPRIDAPARVERGAVVLFDARSSEVGTSTTVIRTWSLVSNPSGDRDRLTDAQTGCQPDRCRRLVPTADGRYIVSLEISANGRSGVTAVAAVEVR